METIVDLWNRVLASQLEAQALCDSSPLVWYGLAFFFGICLIACLIQNDKLAKQLDREEERARAHWFEYVKATDLMAHQKEKILRQQEAIRNMELWLDSESDAPAPIEPEFEDIIPF